MTEEIRQGDALARLREMPTGSVQCVVTSPPYYGLRDYGTDVWEGGDPDCEHSTGRGSNIKQTKHPNADGYPAAAPHRGGDGNTCVVCGARRVSPWIGGDPDCDHRRNKTPGAGSWAAGQGIADERGKEAYRAVCERCGARRSGQWVGGDPNCDHSMATARSVGNAPSLKSTLTTNNGAGPQPGDKYQADRGRKVAFACSCGARWTTSQLGLESTPDEYVERLVDIFREIRRVLRDDGTVWLNLGDSYNAYNGNAGQGGPVGLTQSIERPKLPKGYGLTVKSLKAKDLIGIPWMVAFALRADGWYLRSDVIWAKPNPMPESVIDRPTSAHEHVFLLTKNARYFYDADAIREDYASGSKERILAGFKDRYSEVASGGFRGSYGGPSGEQFNLAGRNKRNVWTVPTQPYAEAHFATFPAKLVEPCVLAGTGPKACGQCGAPWQRVTETEHLVHERWFGDKQAARHSRGEAGTSYREPIGMTTTGWEPTCDCRPKACSACGAPWQRIEERAETSWAARREAGATRGNLAFDGNVGSGTQRGVHGDGVSHDLYPAPPPTTSWQATCDCGEPPTEPDGTGRSLVLDPFAGSGTVGVVARWHGRDFVGIELNADYCELARRRILLEGNPGRRAAKVEALPGQMAMEI